MKDCRKDQVRNPKTKRCVKKKGKVGKKVLKGEKKTCPKNKIVNPKTNRCVKRDGKVGKEVLKKYMKVEGESRVRRKSSVIKSLLGSIPST